MNERKNVAGVRAFVRQDKQERSSVFLLLFLTPVISYIHSRYTLFIIISKYFYVVQDRVELRGWRILLFINLYTPPTPLK